MSEHPLKKILNPSSIAFIGASNRIETMGTVHLNTLLHDGFKGPIYPIHLKEKTVLGLKTYRDINELPEVPDLLVMLVNRDHLLALIEKAGKFGIRQAVIISGGFAESSDHGPELQDKLHDIAKQYGIHIIGPNCIGVLNPWSNMNVTYFPYTGNPGVVGMLSHSGTYLCHMYTYLKRRGIGLAGGISLGNEVNIDMTDGIEYFTEDDNVKAISLYIETIRRPRKFIDQARKTISKKPIVALSVGSSEAGARAAATHTASIAGNKGILKGILDQAGVIRAKGIQELYDFADVLSKCPPLKGKRIAIITNSGGPGATAAESLEQLGMECPELSLPLQEKIKKLQPHTASARNPVDFTYTISLESFYLETPKILLESTEIDGLLIYGIFGIKFWKSLVEGENARIKIPDEEPMLQMLHFFYDKLAELPKIYGKPIITVNFDGFADDGNDALRERGMPVLASPERGTAAMWALHKYEKYRSRLSH